MRMDGRHGVEEIQENGKEVDGSRKVEN